VSREPFVLVLDDVHRVTETRSQMAIGYLGERLPAGRQLAMATRTDPPLPLELASAWPIGGAARDGDAGALLSAAGVTLSPGGVARTDGWAATLLAALSVCNHSQPEAFVERFAGTSRHVGYVSQRGASWVVRPTDSSTSCSAHVCLQLRLVTHLGRHVRLPGQRRDLALGQCRAQQRPDLPAYDDTPDSSPSRHAVGGPIVRHHERFYSRHG
jgi:hypothetical protein